MSAFAAAVGALFADPNIGKDAVYIGDRPVSPLWRSSRVTCYAAWAA
jgi:hypothetical protein